MEHVKNAVDTFAMAWEFSEVTFPGESLSVDLACDQITSHAMETAGDSFTDEMNAACYKAALTFVAQNS